MMLPLLEHNWGTSMKVVVKGVVQSFKDKVDSLFIGVSAKKMSKDIRKLVDIMKYGGMWFDYSTVRVGWFFKGFQISRLVFNFCILTLSGYGIFVTSGVKEKLGNNGFFFTVTLMIMLQQFIAVVKLQNFKRILNTFGKMWSKRVTLPDRELFSLETALAWKFIRFFKLTTYFQFAVYLWLPLIIDIGQALFTSETKPYYVPMPLSEFLDSENIKRTPYFYLVTITTSIWLQSNALTCIAVQSNFCVLVFYTVAEIKILRSHIAQLVILDDGTFDRTSEFTLGRIVQEHQAIIRLYRQVKDYVGPQLAVQNIISSVSMCISFYVISNKANYDIIVIAGSSLMCVSFFGLMFFVCQLGENLTSQGISINEEMYEKPWYNLNPKQRKDVYLVIMQAQQPMTINYRGTSTINVNTFSQIVNATYSYFTLLKTLF